MKKHLCILMLGLSLHGGPVFAQHAEELYSPYFFGLGLQSTSLQAPMAVVLNPATASLEQRVHFELSYLALIGSSSDPGWGSAINLGISLPTNFAVFSFTANYIGSPLTSVALGNQAGLRFVISKDLFPDFLIGLAISGSIGWQGEASDWGLGADLGFIHRIEKFLFLQDFTWGVAFRNLGKGLQPGTGSDYFPQAFTPAVGVSFDLVKSQPFRLGLYADASFPSFQNILFFSAAEIVVLETFSLRATYRLDVKELATFTNRFPAMFGLSLNFRIDLEQEKFLNERGWGKNDIRVDLAFAPLQNDTLAMGLGFNAALGMKDDKGPVISIKPIKPEGQGKGDDTIYISPNLDGKQDNLELFLNISDERFVKGYYVIIKDEKGNVVRKIVNKEERPENLDLDNIFNRLAYVKSGVKVPEKIVWDGKNDNGNLVPDGIYTYEVEAWDDNGNRSKTEPRPVVVDATPPKVDVKPSYTIFSPNGDGQKDTLPLELTGSAEDKWIAVFKDEKGNIVSSIEWTGQPQSFAWDGKDKDGKLLPDGVYTLEVSSVDRASNSTLKKIDNIIINTEATPVFLTVDAEVFSPNNDRIADSITLNVILGNSEGIKSWQMEMLHEKKGVVKVFSGSNIVLPKIVWDGKTNEGKLSEEGLYTARLTVEYIKGDRPIANSKAFRLDVSGPEIEIAFDPMPFSPDNDGVEDELNIKLKINEPSGVESWQLEIKDPMGAHFISFTGQGQPPSQLVWDGLSDRGELVQAASDYQLIFTITDTVGNKAVLQKTIMVDVLVIRDGDKLYIRVPSITFKPNTDDYKSVAKEALEKNMWTLKRLAEIFKKYKNYQIQIEGHAVSVYWEDPKRAEREQQEELIPLSTKRAEAIKKALVSLGIEASRIQTIGIGASRPIVPFSDKENLWKNRRVEFILIKK